MSEEMIGVLQHFRTRNGRELRFRPLRRCRDCGQPSHRQQAEPLTPETASDFWKALAVMVMLVAAGIASIIAAAGYVPVPT